MMSIASALAPYIFAGDKASRSNEEGFVSHRLSSDDADELSTSISLDSVDVDLASRIQAGDVEAMRTLVLNYADNLTRFAFTLVRCQDEAEEIAYDVLSNVWQQKQRLQPNRSLKAYLFTGVRHRALDKLAHDRVRERFAARIGNDPPSQASSLSPEDLLFAATDENEKKEQINALRDAISTLSDRHQLCLHLRFDQGLSYPEMGKILSISDKAAQQIVLRAIGTLRRLLGV